MADKSQKTEQKNSQLSSQPYKGARDFYPTDMRFRNYIFSKWKKVCERYGFEEYDFPIIEPLEIFTAKSGAEIVNEQLFNFEDKSGRKITMRPELTPGTVRLIAQKFKELNKPIKWFMIGNNWRYEKPQMGRGREFYQLEANIFGVESYVADFEIISLIVALMSEFGANESQFEIMLSDRRLLNLLLSDSLKLSSETQVKVRRLMDKRSKISQEEFFKSLEELGLSTSQCNKVEAYLNATLETLEQIIPAELLKENQGYISIMKLFDLLKQNDLSKYCQFDPAIIRGFDYSDGLVYEVYDKNPDNRRSMFGGERFDRLINIFGDFELPATGFAMGDYTLLEFLKYWELLPTFDSRVKYLVTVWPSTKNDKLFNKSYLTAQNLRKKGINCILWPDKNTKLEKQLKYADKEKIPYAIVMGEEELDNKELKVKNLETQAQETFDFENFFSEVKS